MAITLEQRQARRQFVGSSDAAAIMGLDKFKSAADVWLEKTDQLNEWAGNAATDRGAFLEPAILNFAEKRLGHFARDEMRVHENGILATNFDGINIGYVEEPFIVEAKSSVLPEEWGPEETDQVPDRVVVQCHHAMYVAGPEYRVAFVPVLLPGFRSFDFRMYRIDRKDELADAIAAECIAFVADYIRPLIRPSEFRPSLDVLKRVKRVPNKSVPVSDKLVAVLAQAKELAKTASERAKEAEAALLAEIGDAEAATYSGGEISYFETNRKGYTVEPCAFRQLRIKPAKK